MASEAIFDNLVRILRLLNTGRVSIYDLVRQSGYFEGHGQVDESGLREALSRHPECVDEWMSYSDDKCTDSGWYIKQEGSYFAVGYFPHNRAENTDVSYADRIDACAAFIKHELEDIRAAV